MNNHVIVMLLTGAVSHEVCFGVRLSLLTSLKQALKTNRSSSHSQR